MRNESSRDGRAPCWSERGLVVVDDNRDQGATSGDAEQKKLLNMILKAVESWKLLIYASCFLKDGQTNGDIDSEKRRKGVETNLEEKQREDSD